MNNTVLAPSVSVESSGIGSARTSVNSGSTARFRSSASTDTTESSIATTNASSVFTGSTPATAIKLPLYLLPPEVWAADELSLETDVWSFGILLWEMFTGGQHPLAYMLRVRNVEAGNPNFSSELESILSFFENYTIYFPFKCSSPNGPTEEAGSQCPGQSLDKQSPRHLTQERCLR